MWLIVDENGDRRRVAIRSATFSIGRDEGCDLVLIDSQVSGRHAQIARQPDGGLQLTDLASTNGTWVDGQRIAEPVELRGGERIGIGRATLTVDARSTERGSTEVVQPVLGEQRVAAEAGPPRSESAVMRVSRAVAGSPSGVMRQLQRTAQRAIWVSVLAVVVALAAIGAAVAAALGAFSNSTPTRLQAAAPQQAATPTDIARTAAPSTVFIIGEGGAGIGPLEAGSGWVWGAGQGLIVTNAHVAEGAPSLQLTAGTAPGAAVSPRRRRAALVGADPCQDVALLRVTDTTGLRTLPLGAQSNLHAGDSVVALGFPASLANAMDLSRAVLIITSGTVSSPRTQIPSGTSPDLPDLPNVIQLPPYMSTHGNSGGPLVDGHSELVGMNTAGSRSDFAYAIGVDQIKALVPQLERGSINDFGFILDPGVLTAAAQSGETWLPAGLGVDGAVNGTPAARIRFPETAPDPTRPFNPTNNPPPAVLTTINGVRLRDSKTSYCAAVKGLTRGQTVAVTLQAPDVTVSGRLFYRPVRAQLTFQ
jgi:S1-C subfamily serine protease